MYYLDTNICIYFFKGTYPKINENILRVDPLDIRIPALVKAELLTGAYKSNRRELVLKQLDILFRTFKTEDFTDDMAKTYAEIRSDLEMKGKPIGPIDTIIASIVKHNNGTLVSHNIKEFERVSGLELVDWTVN